MKFATALVGRTARMSTTFALLSMGLGTAFAQQVAGGRAELGLKYEVSGVSGVDNILRDRAGLRFANVGAAGVLEETGLAAGGGGGGMMAGAKPNLVCATEPSEAYAGEPMVATTNWMDVSSTKSLTYEWRTNGGLITGQDTAQIDTTGLAPGTYSVTGRLVDGGKPIASCATVFSIHDDRPSLGCMASPWAVAAGEQVMFTVDAENRLDRPMTYSYTTTRGSIDGSGATAMLKTDGATPGTITVLCNASTDKGLTGGTTATIVITAPPVPLPTGPYGNPKPRTAVSRNLCTLTFTGTAPRTNEVDGAGMTCLDNVAMTLNQDQAARLVLVGNHPASEEMGGAQQRAENARAYLTQQKGIDPARVDVRIVSNPAKTVSTVLLPPGVVFESNVPTP